VLILHYNNFKSKIFIYVRYKLKLFKGNLTRDDNPLDKSSTLFSQIQFPLKIKKEKIKKPNIYLKIILSYFKIC
jgi:hypothetical protein